MKENILDWLKLNIAVRPGVRIGALVSFFGSASAVYAAPKKELLRSGRADEGLIDKILGADEREAADMLALCEKYGWSIVTPDSPYYPGGLRMIKDFPFVLFCSGDISLLRKEPKISVVGTREPSEKSLMATYLLTCALSSLDLVTVSGGALGIDSAAHEGALTGNGGTIAVLGSGLGSAYLPENSFMRRRIENNGLLVTELSPFTEPSKYTFPRRNRIIAAMSEATLVAESGVRGGSLITADYALKQHKKLFCFSPEITDSPGCADLLECGAMPCRVPADILRSVMPYGDIVGFDVRYTELELKNDGIHGVHIIKHSSMTADSFAAYNGITPDEARRVLGSKLKQPAKADLRKPSAAKQKKAPAADKSRRAADAAAGSAEIAEFNAEVSDGEVSARPDGFFSENARVVFDVLTKEPQYFDEIQYKTLLSPRDVMTAVTELELGDLATLHPGNRVSRT